MSRRAKQIIFENVEVIDAGAKGKSVAKAPDGRVIFLQNAIPGDVVDIQTFKKRKSFYEGKAIAFHKLSEKRTQPPCKHFGVCGGCKWQHMKYEEQLFYKQKEVENNLKRIGGLDLPSVSPIIGSADEYFYRNKMEFSFSDSRWLTQKEINSETEIQDRNALGLHMPGMWDKVLDIDKCWLQPDPSNAIRNSIKEFATQNGMEFFNTRNQTGFLRTLMIRTSSTGEVMVVIQFYKENKKNRELLLKFVKEKFSEVTSLQYVINEKANDTIYDQEVICYHGQDFITEKMESYSKILLPDQF